ncbi:hypothetical protein PsWM33_04171 [Pseudovibrio sp. WM33]|nr:hypothetical protein PsWM33_04171 [Pseudovibrio sp. WM33]
MKACVLTTNDDINSFSRINLKGSLQELREVKSRFQTLSFAYIVLTQGTKAKSSREGALLNLFIYHEVKW